MSKTLTMMIMDPPYEASATTSAFRVIEAALRQGHNVNVFAFEGAVSLALAGQKAHPNPVHQTTVEEEKHPTTRAFVSGMFKLAAEKGVKLDWVNCGFCVDERGAEDWVEGPRRGGPPDFHKMLAESHASITIPTR